MSQRQVDKQWFSKADALIKNGQAQTVASDLKDFSIQNLADDDRLPFAEIARRCGRYEIQIEVLRPLIVHAKNHRKARLAEEMEYCMGLLRLGAVQECELRLAQVEETTSYAALFVEMQLGLSRFDYPKAIDAGKMILNLGLDDPYKQAVVQLNLAAGYVGDRQVDEAQKTLLALNVSLKKNGWHQLLMNSYELTAQVFLLQKLWDQAEDCLELATQLGQGASERSSLFVERWRASLKAHKEQSVLPLNAFKKHAQGHAPTLRSIDFECLTLQFDEEIYHHLYFGSPYPALRRQLEQQFGVTPESYQKTYLGGGPILDLEVGQWNHADSFSLHQQVGKVCMSLFSDFYATCSVGLLFEQLFPDESFLGETSVARVRQAISRFSKQAQELHLPLMVEKKGPHFDLKIEQALSVKVVKDYQRDQKQGWLSKLQDSFEQSHFSAVKAQNALDVTLSKTHRILAQLCQEGEIIRTGFGSKTQYLLSESQRS